MNVVPSPNAARSPPSAAPEHLALLRAAAGQPSLCSVRASGRPESYLSRTFAIDEASGSLLVDLPRPPVLVRALVPGAHAEIELTLRHIRLAFESQVVRVGPIEGKTALFLALPSEIRQRQRRELGRVAVPKESSARFTLDPKQQNSTQLSLKDVGPGGVCVGVHGHLDEYSIGHIYDAAEFMLPDGTVYSCSVRITHASVVRYSEIRLGLQFTKTSSGLDLAVAQLIEDIARGSSPRAHSV